MPKAVLLGSKSMLCKREIDIAQGQRGDYDGIILVLRRSYPHPEDPEVIRQNVLFSQNVVAKIGGRIVGSVSYTNVIVSKGKVVETPRYRKNKMYYVWGLAVLPEYRGRGIAAHLVREAERGMYRKKANGYFGNAFSEEVAQWWVCMFGVRLRRLALDRLMTTGVPFEKRFRQEGFFEDLKAKCRELISSLLARTYTRAKTAMDKSCNRRLC